MFERMGGVTVTLDHLDEISEPFDIVVEASGNPSGFECAMKHIRPRGILVLKSTYHGTLTLDAAPIVINEISIIGSRCGIFGPPLRLMNEGLVDPSPLVDEVFPFERAEQAFRKSQEPGVFKVLMEF